MTIILKNPSIKINSVQLNNYVAQVELDWSYEEVDTTTFDGSGAMSRVAGLQNSSLSITFLQDFSAASVDATISPLLGGTSSFEILPAGTTASATNPKYTGKVLITSWTPLSGAPGDRGEADVDWPCVGAVTRATA